MPVRVVEVPDVHAGGLGEQAAFGLQLDAPHEQGPPVSHVGAQRALDGGGEPQADEHRDHDAEGQAAGPCAGDLVDEPRTQEHGNRRHGRVHHPEQRVADEGVR